MAYGLNTTTDFGDLLQIGATIARVTAVPKRLAPTPRGQSMIAQSLADEAERWIIAFAIGTGLRQNEMWSLHVADIHVDDDAPFVHAKFGSKGKTPKNKKTRKVPLFGVGLQAAKAWLGVLPAYAPSSPEGLLFPTPRREKTGTSGGHVWEGGARRQVGKAPAAWRTAKAALGDRNVWWRLLRHTSATALVCGWWGRKWSLAEVGKLLGHGSVRTTAIYGNLLDSTRIHEDKAYANRRARRKLHIELRVRGEDAVFNIRPWCSHDVL